MLVLDPIVGVLVRGSARLGVDPLWLVTVQGACGLAAAVFVASGGGGAWRGAALLLLIEAILDAAAGRLARATGRLTRIGRYAGAGVRLIAHVALFAALGLHVGAWPAVAGLVALTFLLSLDRTLERLYRVPRTVADAGPPAPLTPVGAPLTLYRPFERLHRLFLAPQDRLIERLDRAAFRRLEGTAYEHAPLDRRLAWSDRFSAATVTDLGPTTQVLILGVLLLAGRPGLYPPLLVLMSAWALAAQVVRASRYRAYLASDPAETRRAG